MFLNNNIYFEQTQRVCISFAVIEQHYLLIHENDKNEYKYKNKFLLYNIKRTSVHSLQGVLILKFLFQEFKFQ